MTLTKREPKLNTEWMTALGFELVNEPERRLEWRHMALRIMVDDTAPLSNVIHRYTHAVEAKATRVQQAALRDVLLPAMGLEVHDEYSDGYNKRSYVRPE